jgi:hypothetical protein
MWDGVIYTGENLVVVGSHVTAALEGNIALS